MEQRVKSKRGFGSMDAEKQRAIARLGGAAVKKEDRSFSKNRQLASDAGRKGGSVSKRRAEQAPGG